MSTTSIIFRALAAVAIAATASAQSGTPQTVQPTQTICMGDTRGDRRCNHDPTHRVCAEIGDPDTSFWSFTHQHSWCNTRGGYGGQYGNNMRCPLEEPTWCICKWATASWIRGAGCSDAINVDCHATDICATSQGLFFSYTDFDVNLHPAHECVSAKCATQWAACAAANPGWVSTSGAH